MWPLGRFCVGRVKPRKADLMRQLEAQHRAMIRLQRECDINRLNAFHLARVNRELEAELRGEREIIRMFLESTPFWGAFQHFMGKESQ